MSVGNLKVLICPSILNANLANLSSECQNLLSCGADYLHLDVMDGHFVPNISFGPPVIECLRKDLGSRAFFDVHLMVSEPGKWIEPMKKSGASQLTFHLETCNDDLAVDFLIDRIKSSGLSVGLAIKPRTSVEMLLPFVKKLDNALVMTVEPGFGGQSFMPEMLNKVLHIRSKAPHLNLQVDGGVNIENVIKCGKAGANLIVAGTSIVTASDKTKVIAEMRQKVQAGISIMQKQLIDSIEI